jgi:hypothetical protein
LHSHDSGGEKKWESSEREYQLFVDFKKDRREVFYSIVIEFGEHMKLVVVGLERGPLSLVRIIE